MTNDVAVAFVALAVTNAGALFSAYVSLRESNAVLRVEVDRLKKDVDNLGGIMETKRSQGRKAA